MGEDKRPITTIDVRITTGALERFVVDCSHRGHSRAPQIMITLLTLITTRASIMTLLRKGFVLTVHRFDPARGASSFTATMSQILADPEIVIDRQTLTGLTTELGIRAGKLVKHMGAKEL